jgi:carboxymethylenebutenolidase
VQRLFRRDLAGICAAALALTVSACATPQAQQWAVGEQQVSISTPDGNAEALLFTPADGDGPGVVLWADIGGLRPAIADLGRKLAGEGFVVLAPNAFYRTVRLDGTTVSEVDGRTRFTEWRGAATDDAIASDSRAYAAFLDARPEVDKSARIGAVGYDVGSAYSFIMARTVPDRVGMVAIVHPTATATTRDTSPHLFVGQSRASYYVALAADDDTREPEDKDQYRGEFAEAGITATVEVLSGNHGFALPDNDNYQAASADRSWAQMLSLLRTSSGQ